MIGESDDDYQRIWQLSADLKKQVRFAREKHTPSSLLKEDENQQPKQLDEHLQAAKSTANRSPSIGNSTVLSEASRARGSAKSGEDGRSITKLTKRQKRFQKTFLSNLEASRRVFRLASDRKSFHNVQVDASVSSG